MPKFLAIMQAKKKKENEMLRLDVMQKQNLEPHFQAFISTPVTNERFISTPLTNEW